jgi:starch phosphorylase
VPNTTLPPRLSGLAALAGNLSWSWNREARALFAAIDDRLWHRVRHNPIVFLREVDPARLAACADDPAFRAHYDEAMHWLQAEGSDDETWFSTHYPELQGRTIAYFCAEFGLHNSVPIYSGGLGVLAGDHCKTASDLGLPFVGVGILYRSGYFDQKVAPDGWQQDSADPLGIDRTPIQPIMQADGTPLTVSVTLDGHATLVRAWKLMVGRVPVILLDTDLPENRPEARELLSRLYAGGAELRLRQEWLLGVGGVRVLRKLGVQPHVWHANEGHASFMFVERAREFVQQGMSFPEAVKAVRKQSVFTTHTPVPAGHDVFGRAAVDQVIGPVWQEMGIDADTFHGIGLHPEHGPGAFHMTACAVRMSSRVTGVSKLHGEVTREMLQKMWPTRPAEAVPVGHVTNGVHLATWMANPVMQLLDRHLGKGWGFELDDPAVWDRILTLPDAELWAVHRELKDVLFDVMKQQARRSFAQQEMTAAQIVGAGLLLDRHALTIGFARRFATYKRADLLFHDPDRLHRILTHPDRPVQLIYSGKAHPADTPGKTVLQRVYQYTRDPRFEGRVAFLEDYDMHIAHLLVQGVDMWMNVPRVPMEASGTSGMKAALNGVPQFSTIDGWWAEGYDGTNGWAVTGGGSADVAREDAEQAERIYHLLETEVIPRYYDRPHRTAEPKRWLATMKHAIRVAGRTFTASRMVQEYTEQYYVPAMAGGDLPDDPPVA